MKLSLAENIRAYRKQRKMTQEQLAEVLGVTVVMVILIFGGMLVLQPGSNFSAPLFITYIALFSQIVNPAKNIGTAFSNYHRGVAALDRIYEFLSIEDAVEDSDTTTVEVVTIFLVSLFVILKLLLGHLWIVLGVTSQVLRNTVAGEQCTIVTLVGTLNLIQNLPEVE